MQSYPDQSNKQKTLPRNAEHSLEESPDESKAPHILCGLNHSDLHEGEVGVLDLLVRVLTAVLQPRKASDLHDNDTVADAEADARRAIRNRDREVEPRTSRVDRCPMERVEAHLTGRDHLPNLLDRQVLLAQVDEARGKHGSAECETKVTSHIILQQKNRALAGPR